MAKTILKAYETLRATDTEVDDILDVVSLLEIGEPDNIEFKSTLRVNLHTGEKDPRMEKASLKTIAGFLNRDGAVWELGLQTTGKPLG